MLCDELSYASDNILEALPLPQKELISFFNKNNRNLKRFSSEFVNTVFVLNKNGKLG